MKKWNFRYWTTCKKLLSEKKMCFMSEYLNEVCPLFPIRLIKTVRLQMREIRDLIKDPTMNLKIIFLVRDPRGSYSSRSEQAKMCTKEELCSNLSVSCNNLLDNTQV